MKLLNHFMFFVSPSIAPKSTHQKSNAPTSTHQKINAPTSTRQKKHEKHFNKTLNKTINAQQQ